MAISNNIRVVRLQRNLTQKELGTLMHVSDKTISAWESGRSLPDIESIKIMAKILNVKYEVLVDGETELQKYFTLVKLHLIKHLKININVILLILIFLLLVLPNPVFSFFFGFLSLILYFAYLTYSTTRWYITPLLLSIMELVEQSTLYFYGHFNLDYFLMIILGTSLIVLLAQMVWSIKCSFKYKKLYITGILSVILYIGVIVILFIGFRVSNGSAGGQIIRQSHSVLYALIVVSLLGINRIKVKDN